MASFTTSAARRSNSFNVRSGPVRNAKKVSMAWMPCKTGTSSSWGSLLIDPPLGRDHVAGNVGVPHLLAICEEIIAADIAQAFYLSDDR
jgi:hypothetical protein